MPTNKPEVVLPELPEPYQHKVVATSKNTPSVRQGIEMSGYVKSPDLYTADQLRAYGQACIDTLTRPADGEFHECPHCKGWSRTSTQQPAEAVAWVLQRKTEGHPNFVPGDISWMDLHATREQCPSEDANWKPVPVYLTPPPAIDIGKLRELVARWRQYGDNAALKAIGEYGAAVTGAFNDCADELAALIGDGAEKANG